MREFSRRELLAGAVAMYGSPAAALARSDCRKWKVGTSTRLSEKSSAEQFAELKQASIQSVELGVPRMDAPDTAVRFGSLMKRGREWAEAAGIELWSLHVPFARDLDLSSPSEAERQKVVRRLAMCFKGYAPLGVKKLNIHGSYEISKPIPEDERKIRVASSQKSLKELAGKADEIGAQLSLECLPRGCIGNTSAEVLALVAEIPAVGVTLDTNHLLQETPEAFARRVGSRIVNTHVADYDGNDERHWLPGKGIINFAAVVSALEDAGYSGPFMFECAGTPVEKVAVWEKLKKAVAGQRTED